MKFQDCVKKWQSEAFWNFIKTNLDKPWDWFELSNNPNITWEIVQANPDKPWNWFDLSSNPNITWEIVQANPDKPWDWDYLSQNILTLQNFIIREQCRKELLAANLIKKTGLKFFRISTF